MPADESRVTSREFLRDLAVDLLKEHPLTARSSRRLLADLVEFGGGVQPLEVGARRDDHYLILVVVEGEVRVMHTPRVNSEREPGPEPEPITLGRGVYLGGREEGPPVCAERSRAEVFLLKAEGTKDLRRLLRLSNALMRSLDLDVLRLHASQALFGLFKKERARTELVWLTRASENRVPLEPFLHLLGYGASRLTRDTDQLKEIVAAVSLSSDPAVRSKIALWRGRSFLGWEPIVRDRKKDLLGNPDDEAAQLRNIAAGKGLEFSQLEVKAGESIRYAYFVHPERPWERPPVLASTKFDRIAYLTAEVPNAVPAQLLRFLRRCVRGEGGQARFSAFVPMLVRPELPRPPSAEESGPDEAYEEVDSGDFGEVLHGIAARAVALLTRRRHVKARILPDSRARQEEVGIPEWWNRTQRDRVRLRLDPERLENAYDSWPGLDPNYPGEVVSFAEWYEGQGGSPTTAEASGRAVTNKRVGIAVSGGGACAYRLIPFLCELEERNVPIDVYAGVSGGAFIGAYYCAEKFPGVDKAVCKGPLIGRFLWLATVASSIISSQVDDDLKARRVEDLDEDFLAVTLVLKGKEPPKPAIIVSGTLGEAVQASGALPLGFGPMQIGELRFADGAGAGVIPVHALQARGADFAISFNCVPGPEQSNPWHESRLGRWSHDYTLWGRVVDIWAWSAFMLQQTSWLVSRNADVFFEFDPQNIGFRETIEWANAADLIDRARNDIQRLEAAANEAAAKWQALGLDKDVGGP